MEWFSKMRFPIQFFFLLAASRNINLNLYLRYYDTFVSYQVPRYLLPKKGRYLRTFRYLPVGTKVP